MDKTAGIDVSSNGTMNQNLDQAKHLSGNDLKQAGWGFIKSLCGCISQA